MNDYVQTQQQPTEAILKDAEEECAKLTAEFNALNAPQENKPFELEKP